MCSQACLPSLARLTRLSELELLGCITLTLTATTLPQLLLTPGLTLDPPTVDGPHEQNGAAPQILHPQPTATATTDSAQPAPSDSPPAPSTPLEAMQGLSPRQALSATSDAMVAAGPASSSSVGSISSGLQTFTLTQLRRLTLGSVQTAGEQPGVGLDDSCLLLLAPLGHCLHSLKMVTWAGGAHRQWRLDMPCVRKHVLCVRT